MKSLRLMSVVLIALSTLAFAQHDAQKTDAPKSEAQKSFDTMKTLAGSWEGRITTVPPEADVEGKPAQITLRVASMGHTLMHEATIGGRADDPITMFVVEEDRLLLTHYCDGDNRPRMIGRASADGKKVEFDFLDVTGNLKYGHMQHAVFTIVDAGHHIEDWTYLQPGDKPVQAHFDLQRTK